ncbi:MAG: hypothetical protein KatS3mg103_0933 [Phycisphaerales bacterium]|nr:MAG: hypothetical protein KatS3mg103_0933 [Phycisphaerales bacterium]
MTRWGAREGGRLLARIFGQGDNPLRWAVTLYRAWGISVRLHVLFIVYVLLQLLASRTGGGFGPAYTALVLGCLFFIVLLHEYGHCIACRLLGGQADEIVLWPLGGLAFCRPPHHWKAELITVLGGPAVNALLLVPLGVLSGVLGGDLRYAVFNPFQPLVPPGGWMVTVVFLLHWVNLVLLLFNMLVPMYPMDAGRVVHCLLWRSMGYHKGLAVACNVGIFSAMVLAVAALAFDRTLLLGIALFGGLTCWQEKSTLQAMAGVDAWAPPADPNPAAGSRSPAGPTRAQLAAIKKRQQEDAQMERLLDKIARQGMGSLTTRERRTLDRLAKKKRQGPAA